MHIFEIAFPKDYPNNAQQIHFLTPIYHLNVSRYNNYLGFVCPNFIKNWNPSITLENNYIIDKEMTNEYLNIRTLYKSKIQYSIGNILNFLIAKNIYRILSFYAPLAEKFIFLWVHKWRFFQNPKIFFEMRRN